jgi:hypothetical protein
VDLGPEDLQPPGEEIPEHGPLFERLKRRLMNVEALRGLPPPEPLIENYLLRNSLAWLGGRPGSGKSFLAVDLACCVSSGRPWRGNPVAQGRVLYLAAEGAYGLAPRIDAWINHTGQEPGPLVILPEAVQIHEREGLEAMRRILFEAKPSLLVIDTQARVTAGLEENSSKDMGLFVDALERLRVACGACILVVHHEARGAENLRGSTALEGAASTVLRTEKDPGATLVKIQTKKQKDMIEQDPIMLDLISYRESAVLQSITTDSVGGPLSTLQRECLDILGDHPSPLSVSALGERMGIQQNQRSGLWKALGQLDRRKLVLRIDTPWGTRTRTEWTIPREEPEPEPDPEPPPEDAPAEEPPPQIPLYPPLKVVKDTEEPETDAD